MYLDKNTEELTNRLFTYPCETEMGSGGVERVSLMADKNIARRIEYLPPAQEDIHDFASRICQRIAELRDPDFATPEIVYGLAEFMKIAGIVQAKYLNRTDGLIDNDAE